MDIILIWTTAELRATLTPEMNEPSRDFLPFRASLCVLLLQLGCGPVDATADDRKGEADSHRSASLEAPPELPGESLTFRVLENDTTFVDLDRVRVVDDTASATDDWDLAFVGWEVFTNSGPSGPGDGAAFGPLDELDFLFDEPPNVPFLRPDRTGGAFLDWYSYDGSTHQLWSRYHVYGVRRGADLWKVQVLGYYGEQHGAPVSALYSLRYARMTEGGAGPVREVSNLDATAGYPEVTDERPSGCISFASGDVLDLKPQAARDSTAWDLCFRRDSISVNGEQGGAGDVSAVDLDLNRTASETLEEVQQRTPESELPAFDAVDHARISDPGLSYRGDRVVSIFGDLWYEGRGAEATPRSASWLVQGADGEQQYLVVFRVISGSDRAAGEVTLRVRPVADR